MIFFSCRVCNKGIWTGLITRKSFCWSSIGLMLYTDTCTYIGKWYFSIMTSPCLDFMCTVFILHAKVDMFPQIMHVKFLTHKQFMYPYVSIRFFMHCYVSWAFSQLSHPCLHLSLCLRMLNKGYLINNIVFCFVLWSSICGQLCWNVFVRGAKNIYFSYSWPQDANRNKQCHL